MMLNFGNAKGRVAASAIVLTVIAAPAFGADLPARKGQPLAPPPAFTWTGLYIGFTFAHTWTGSDPIDARTVNLADSTLTGFGQVSALGANGVVGARLDGFLSGGQIGYNWQFTDNFVVGLEADVSGVSVRGGGGFGNIVANGPASYAVTSATLRRSLEYLGTVRGRLGYAVTPNILVYATGGLAFGGANQTLTLQQTLVPSALVARTVKGNQYDNLVGWTIGGGAEMALSRALSAKLEYLYYDLGQLSLSGSGMSPFAFSNIATGAVPLVNASAISTRINGHLLRLGLNYRFDWSVPETASGATPLFANPAVTAAPASTYGDWQFSVMLPYMWALGTNGALTARGHTAGADSSFIDGFTQTSSFPLSFAGRVEARNGPLSFFGDFAWFQARFSGSTLVLRSPSLDLAFAANAAARFKQTMAFGEGGVAYEVGRYKLGASEAITAVDAYAGFRYAYVGADLRLDVAGTANSPLLGLETIGFTTVARSGAMRWIDPLVGLRFRHQLSPAEEFQLRGDIGGFGAGSKFSWQCFGGYNRDFEVNGLKFTGTLGYRVLGINYARGWGNERRGVDAIFHGPLSGVSMRF